MHVHQNDFQQKCPHCEATVDLRPKFEWVVACEVRLRVDAVHCFPCPACGMPVQLSLRYHPVLILGRVSGAKTLASRPESLSV